MEADVEQKSTWKSGLTVGDPVRVCPVWAGVGTRSILRYPATSRDIPPLREFFLFFSLACRRRPPQRRNCKVNANRKGVSRRTIEN